MRVTNTIVFMRNRQFLFGSCLFFLLLVLWVSTDAFADGNVKCLKDYEYWDTGKVRECTIYDVNGYLKARIYCRYDGTTEEIEKYNYDGNKIEEARYDANGNLKRGIDGWAAMRWWYIDAHLVVAITYDEDGRPMERKQYSESGRLVLRHYRDDIDFNPYQQANMYMLLGGNNIAYRDSRVELEQEAGLVNQ